MKAIYILLIFSIWQSILSVTDFVLDVVDGPASMISCYYDQIQKNYYYGFSFKAYTSGFEDASKTFQFFLGSPYYAFTDCTVPQNNGEDAQDIVCYVNAYAFPLYDKNPTIELPTKTENEQGIIVENWNNLLKNTKTITFSESCYPQYEYEIKSSLKLYCQKYEGIEYKALFGTATFTKNQQNLRNLEGDYITYSFKTHFYVDNEITQVDCELSNEPEDEDENSTEYGLSCDITGENNAILFPTTARGDIDFVDTISKFNVNQKISLNCNKSYYLSSTFTRFAGLLILSLILF